MSADEIARMLKPGVALSGTSSDVMSADIMSADAIAAALKPRTPVGATRSIVAGVKQSTEPEAQPTVNLNVNFATNSSRLTPEARAQLNQLGKAIQYPELQDLKFQVGGHTDARGSAQTNMVLSQKRAEAVVSYLITEYSIQPSRLEAVGFGEDQLFDSANPASGKNRRVEVKTE